MSCKLNEYNEKTKRVIHLMVTSLCLRNCKYCCNKQYSLDDVPYVTDAELKECEILCLTGGEPFMYSQPNVIAQYYKNKYSNIKKVYVYTNAYELCEFGLDWEYTDCGLENIDGLNVSIKTKLDLDKFNLLVLHPSVQKLKENRLYVFNKLSPEYLGNFKVFEREWQEDFKPADDSIFRKI